MSIFIAGHNGMVGSAILRKLKEKNKDAEIILKTREELDLTNQSDVTNFYKEYSPNEVIIAAAKVGGINANNSYPADFIYDNLLIQCNLIHGAYKSGVKKLLFLGSSCIYPKESENPIKEESLLTGELEKTNEPYAIAKIAGIKLCESYNRQYGLNYLSVMPSNLYGPGDNYDLENSHVIPALIKKFYEAKAEGLPSVNIWGSGKPLREFLHVDDLAEASLVAFDGKNKSFFASLSETCSHINIGSGREISIYDLAILVKEIFSYDGKIKFDDSMPDGTMRKLLDISKITDLGWKPKISLRDGLTRVINDYIKEQTYS